MSKVYLRDFYDCDNIDLSCELLYVCELGKYIYFNIENKELSLKGIKFDKVLMESNIWFYFCLAIDEQWLVDVEVDKEWLIDLSSLNQKEWKEMSLVLNNVIFTETKDLDETTRKVIAGYKKTRSGFAIETYDKIKALELLGKYLGMFKDEAPTINNNIINPYSNLSEDELRKLAGDS